MNSLAFSAVVFDLDGTLLDTLQDIGTAANDVLESMGRPVHPLKDYRYLVGDGVAVLFQRALPETIESSELAQRCIEGFRLRYAERWNETSGPYAGIPELLTELEHWAIPKTVLSNKPHAFTLQCVEEFLGSWNWASIVGQSERVPPKPNPLGLVAMMARLGLSPERVLYVGDTNTDMRTAVAGGCYPLGVTWGFRDRQELLDSGARQIVEHPSEILEIIRNGPRMLGP